MARNKNAEAWAQAQAATQAEAENASREFLRDNLKIDLGLDLYQQRLTVSLRLAPETKPFADAHIELRNLVGYFAGHLRGE